MVFAKHVNLLTYNDPGLFYLPCELGVLGEEAIARVNHVDAMLQSNLDDFVAGEVSSDRRILSSLSDNISLVGLLSVHAETVLVAEDGHSLKGQLVGGTEDPDWDLSTVGDENLLQLHNARIGPDAMDGLWFVCGVVVVLEGLMVGSMVAMGLIVGHGVDCVSRNWGGLSEAEVVEVDK